MTMPPPAVLVTSLETADHVHQTGARTEALVLTVEPKRVAQALCWLVLGIVIVGTIANVVIYNVAPSLEHPLAKLMMRFDLGHEPSIPAWYSSIALLASSVLLAAVALASRRRHAPYVRHWAGLALIFLGLAVDEVVMFHEGLGRPITERFDTHGILYLPWVIPGAAFVLAVAAAYSRFLLHLPSRTGRLFVAAGAIFVGGAIGMELAAAAVIEAYTDASLYHTAVQTIEESLEMLGIVLFIYALLDYLQRMVGTVTFRGATRWAGTST